MKTTRWILVLAALAIAGCGGDGGDGGGGPPDPFLATLTGTWITCVSEGFGIEDYSEALTFPGTGTSFTLVVRGYATTDDTCGGTGTFTDTAQGTFVLGGEVTATVGSSGPSVTARAVDASLPGEPTFYTIAYVDTAANPDVLYMGDESVDPARDGTTPARRPNVLEDSEPRVKQ